MDRLSALPRELIGRICNVDSAPNCAVSLWKCGSRALQTKIVQGVSVLELRNEDQNFHGTPPKFLSKLSFLRELSIIRGSGRFDHVDRVVDVLLSLSKTLESLTFDSVYHSMSLYNAFCRRAPYTPGSHGEDSMSCKNGPRDPSNRWFDRLCVFPRLHTFQIIGESNYAPVSLKSLPLSLTKLSVPLPNGSGFIGDSVQQVKYTLMSLPPDLLELELFLNSEESPDFLACLPPKLTRFKFDAAWLGDYVTHSLVDALPKTLLYLEIDSIVWNKALPAAMPPLLEHFVGTIEETGDESKDGPFAQIQGSDFDCFPSTLKEMSLNLPSQNIGGQLVRHLPRSLTKLSIEILHLDDLKASDWPQGLTDLAIIGSVSGAPISLQDILPPSLLKLELEVARNAFTDTSDYQLPSGLEVFMLTSRTASLPKILPPRLKRLNLNLSPDPVYEVSNEKKPVFYALPDSLDELEVHYDTARHFIPFTALPPLLKSLSVRRLEFDDKNDTGDKLAKARFLRQIGRTKARIEEVDPLASDDPNNVSIFDLLPRSLTHLEMHASREAAALEPELWARLPPHLTSLQIQGSIFMPNALKDYIHLKHIRSLTIPMAEGAWTISQ